jgi:hypothetical protein
MGNECHMEQQRIPRAAGPRLHPRRLDAAGIAVLETIVGIWLFISPVALLSHPGAHEGALINCMAVGGILVVTGIMAALRSSASFELSRTLAHRRWTWMWGVLGLWLLVSPWVVGFSSATGLTVNVLICAVVVLGLAYLNWTFTNQMGPDEHRGIVPPSGRLDVEP